MSSEVSTFGVLRSSFDARGTPDHERRTENDA